MRDTTLNLIKESDKQFNKTYRMLDFFNCDFKVNEDILTVKINDFALNMIDINCDQENVFGGPFYIKFNNNLNLEENNIQECDWNEYDEVLKLNDIEIKIIDSDLFYFIQDFGADETKSINNMMKHFCDWVKRNYR